MSDERNLSPRDQRRVEKLRALMAQIETGEIQGVPNNEAAIEELQKEILATQEGRSTATGEPGAYVQGGLWPHGPVPDATLGYYPEDLSHQLVLGVGSPVPEDFWAFQQNHVEFALIPMGKLLVTVVRWPSTTIGKGHGWGYWCDAPWAHTKEMWFDLKPLELEGSDPQSVRYGVQVFMIDSDTNRIAAMRFFTLSPHYSRTYHRELAERLSASPITRGEFCQLADAYQARYPNPKMMLDRAVARCKAGLKD